MINKFKPILWKCSCNIKCKYCGKLTKKSNPHSWVISDRQCNNCKVHFYCKSFDHAEIYIRKINGKFYELRIAKNNLVQLVYAPLQTDKFDFEINVNPSNVVEKINTLLLFK